MPPAVHAEGLGKTYVIRHEGAGQTTLRDSISNGFRSFANALRRRQRLMPGSSREVFSALSDITFQVDMGERVGIIGRNGAGKSTLLKILSRVTEPTHGRVELRGRVASLLEVGT